MVLSAPLLSVKVGAAPELTPPVVAGSRTHPAVRKLMMPASMLSFTWMVIGVAGFPKNALFGVARLALFVQGTFAVLVESLCQLVAAVFQTVGLVASPLVQAKSSASAVERRPVLANAVAITAAAKIALRFVRIVLFSRHEVCQSQLNRYFL